MGSKIRNASNRGLDGSNSGQENSDRLFGQTAADQFYRFFGDTSGDRTVGIAEFNQFRSTFGKSATDQAFNELFDFDGDGIIGVSDFNSFRARFGKNLPFSG